MKPHMEHEGPKNPENYNNKSGTVENFKDHKFLSGKQEEVEAVIEVGGVAGVFLEPLVTGECVRLGRPAALFGRFFLASAAAVFSASFFLIHSIRPDCVINSPARVDRCCPRLVFFGGAF